MVSSGAGKRADATEEREKRQEREQRRKRMNQIGRERASGWQGKKTWLRWKAATLLSKEVTGVCTRGDLHSEKEATGVGSKTKALKRAFFTPLI